MKVTDSGKRRRLLLGVSIAAVVLGWAWVVAVFLFRPHTKGIDADIVAHPTSKVDGSTGFAGESHRQESSQASSLTALIARDCRTHELVANAKMTTLEQASDPGPLGQYVMRRVLQQSQPASQIQMVVAEGYCPQIASGLDQEIEMHASATLTLEFQDLEGLPWTETEVSARLFGAHDGCGAASADGGTLISLGKTGSDGTIKVAGVPRGSGLDVYLAHAVTRVTCAWQGPDRRSIRVTFPRATYIHGTLVWADGGTPVQGEVVNCNGLGETQYERYSARSDDKGQFQIECPRSGLVQLSTAVGLGASRDVDRGTEPIYELGTWDIKQGIALEGQVINVPAGLATDALWLTARAQSPTSSRVVIAPDGAFTVQVPLGQVTLDIGFSADHEALLSRQFQVPCGRVVVDLSALKDRMLAIQMPAISSQDCTVLIANADDKDGLAGYGDKCHRYTVHVGETGGLLVPISRDLGRQIGVTLRVAGRGGKVWQLVEAPESQITTLTGEGLQQCNVLLDLDGFPVVSGLWSLTAFGERRLGTVDGKGIFFKGVYPGWYLLKCGGGSAPLRQSTIVLVSETIQRIVMSGLEKELGSIKLVVEPWAQHEEIVASISAKGGGADWIVRGAYGVIDSGPLCPGDYWVRVAGFGLYGLTLRAGDQRQLIVRELPDSVLVRASHEGANLDNILSAILIESIGDGVIHTSNGQVLADHSTLAMPWIQGGLLVVEHRRLGRTIRLGQILGNRPGQNADVAIGDGTIVLSEVQGCMLDHEADAWVMWPADRSVNSWMEGFRCGYVSNDEQGCTLHGVPPHALLSVGSDGGTRAVILSQ